NTTLIWDVKFGDVILTLRDADIVNIASAAFSPKNDKIVTNSWDNSVFIWDANTGKKLAVLKDQHGDIGNRIFDAMGNLVWNIYTGTALLSMPNYPYYIRNSSFSSDGQKIITGSWDNSAHIWNLKTGDIIFTLKGHIDHVTSATFSPNDQYIATTGDNTIRVWDVITGDLLLVIHNDSDKVWRVDFSPDSKRIVFAGGSFARVRNLDILSIPSEDIISYARQILPPQHKKLTPEERRQFFLSAE
ncbi:MAG: hypothetical protein KDK04_25425, partial [Candidatus Competibacteraceae bacterium]|nr:hypothetical protein [Candidatus Competibacteraceae bacterium]